MIARLRGRISTRIGLVAASAVLVVALGQAALVRSTFRAYGEEVQRERALPGIALALALLDAGVAPAELGRALAPHPSVGVALYDGEGRCVLRSRSGMTGVPEVLSEDVRAAADAHPREVRLLGDAGFVAPITAIVARPGSPERYLGYVDAGAVAARAAVRGRVAAASFGLLVLVALLLTWALAGTIRRRVLAASEVVQRIADGALSERLPERGDDELGQLARSFNRMVAQAESLVASLRAAEERRRRLFAAISHELNTPLTSVLGYLEALTLDEDAPAATRRRYLQVAAEQARALEGLARDLETLSRAELGGLDLSRRETDLRQIVEREIEALRLRAEARGVQLQVAGSAATAPLDPLRMAQVVRNVLDNALRHAPDGSTVDLTLEERGDALALRIIDRGDGIPPEHLVHVGEPLFRVDPSRARLTGGRGLGLAIARTVIDAHGGQLTVRSAPGQGTEVELVLPRRGL